jgi:pilin isopeptide linkage protein/fimbrial isopeptide formation D2 family protein
MRKNEPGKKALAILLSAILAGQMLTSPSQTAVAEVLGIGSQDQQLVLVQDDAGGIEDTGDGGAVDNSSTSDDAVAADETLAADDNEKTSEEETLEATKADVTDDGSDQDTTLSTSSDEIVLLSEAVSEYNPTAEPTPITSASGTVNESVTTDASGANTYDGSPIEADDELYLNVAVVFNSENKPTLEKPNVSYEIPSTISLTKQKIGETLLDSKGAKAGTYDVTAGKVILYFDEAWLNSQASEVSSRFSVSFTLADQSKGDGDSQQVVFPGTGTTVTINTKDENVSGNKWAANNGAYNSEDGTYTWIIQVNAPASGATNLQIKDTLGSNLSFVEGSFSMCDQNGNPTGEAAPSTTIDGQVATINLGNRDKGTYYVSYKTTIKSSALEGLKDNTEVDNVENKASWTWGSKTPESSSEITANPTKVKYSMASKSASGTNDDITWTVKLNNGSIKADMGGYTFTDTLGEGHIFKDGTQYTVTDTSGNTIASGNVDSSSSTLEFTLPSDAGKQQLTVIYHTTMTDTTSPDPVKNTVEVTPGDSTYPSGKADATYAPTDDRTYVSKSFVSKNDTGSTANWSSTVHFSNMASTTDVSTVYWQDTISKNPYSGDFNPIVFSNVVLKTTDGTTLTEGTDYTFSQSASSCKVVFLKSATVTDLVGKSDVTITYTTAPQKTDAVPEGGSVFTNTSKVYVNNIEKGKAEASYTVDASSPSVIKYSSSTSWDANYDNGDDTKGAYVTSWKVVVNAAGEWNSGVVDLAGQDLVVTDKLPDNMKYVSGSVKVNLVGNTGYASSGYYSASVTASEGTGTVSFTIPTSGVATDGHWVGRVEMNYQTAVKASDIAAGETVTFTNSASAESGTTSFPSGSGSTTIKNEVLSKSSTNENGDQSNKGAAIKYTINVNPNALDLVDDDTLTLTDTMSATLSYTAGTLAVTTADGLDITSNCTVNVENVEVDGKENTVLTITVPDSQKLTVSYTCTPIGVIDKTVNISNTCSLSGMASSATTDSKSWTVAKSSASADAVSYGLSLIKYAQNDTTNRLADAEFTLYEVDLNTGEKGAPIATSSTDSNGLVTFGTKASPLEASKLYFVEETKAPENYQISYSGTYVMFYPATATTEAVSNFEAAYQKAQDLGHEPIVGTVSDPMTGDTGAGVTVPVYDRLESGVFHLDVTKTVEGNNPPNQNFQFTAVAVGDNASSAPKLDSISISTDGVGNYTGRFDGTLTDEMVGQTFTYAINEVKDPTADECWNFDTTTITAKVAVKQENGVISADVTYQSGEQSISSAEFTNQYLKAEYAVKVMKTVVNASVASKDEQFSFALYEVDENNQKKTEEPYDTVSASQNMGTQSFKNLTFTKAGTYKYVIEETTDLSDKTYWVEKAEPNYVTITVGFNDNALAIEDVQWSGRYQSISDNTDKAGQMLNQYSTSGEATVKVQKTINGMSDLVLDAQQEFTFGLFEADDQGNSTGDAIDSVTVNGTQIGQEISFHNAISFDKEGTYTYVVKETGLSTTAGTWGSVDDVSPVKVTITATDNGEGRLDTVVKYGNSDAATSAVIDNKVEASATANISVMKYINGKFSSSDEWLASQEFYFQLFNAGKDGEATGKQLGKIVTLKLGKSAYFDELTYGVNDIGTHTYVIKETAVASGFMDHDPMTVNVKVAWDATSGLKTTVEYTPVVDVMPTTQVFNNIYNYSGEATVQVKKTVNGSEVRTEGDTTIYNFSLYDKEGYTVNADGTVSGTEVAKIGVAQGGTTHFTKFHFTEEGTHEYVIHETSAASDGWTNAEDVYVTVEVTKDESGNLVSEVTYKHADGSDASTSAGDAALMDNTYAVTGDATINVSKTVVGGTDQTADETFSFELKDSDGNVIDTVNGVKNGETKAFNKITYSLDDAGKTFNYVVTETGTDGKWTASADVPVTVTVTKTDDNKTVNTTVKYGNSEEATSAAFQNTYVTSGEATLSVYKTVNGSTKALDGEKFTFKLYNAAEYAEKGEQAKALGTVNAAAGQTVNFNSVKLTEAGTYNYVIHEIMDTGEGWIAASDVPVTVTATDNGNHTLNVSVKYGESDTATSAAFDNIYNSTATATINVSKTVVGGTDQTADETFDFELKDSDGNVVDTVTGVRDGGTASFGALEFKTSDLGGADSKEFSYVVHEVGHNSDGWTAAADVPVTVTVTEGADRSLSAVVSYGESSADTAAKFKNRYSTSGSATLGVEKTINGGSIAVKDEQFSFELYSSDEHGHKTSDTALETVKVNADGKASFQSISYDNNDAGHTYYYLIHEDATNLGTGWTAADDVLATVTVTDSGKGTLNVNVTYSNGTNAAEFDNTYLEGTSIVLTGKKVYKDVSDGTEKDITDTLVEGQFHFVATEMVDGVETNVAAGTNGIKGTDADVISFTEIAYTEPGVHTYTLFEDENDDTDNVKTDDTKYRAVVTVAKNDEGDGLTASVVYQNEDGTALDGDSVPTFTNKYNEHAANVDLNFKKVLEGADLAENQYAFRLYTNEEGQTPKFLASAHNDADGNVVFDGLYYDESDKDQTYNYKVVEVAGSDSGVVYDETAYLVSVKVNVEDGDAGATVTTEVTYKNSDGTPVAEGVTPTFTNKYYAPTELALSVLKTVDNGDIREGESFSFELLDEDNRTAADEATQLSTLTVNYDSPTASFDKVNFTKAGEYHFTISEQAIQQAGWQTADDVSVTVTVAEDDTTHALKITSVKKSAGDSEQSETVNPGTDGSYVIDFDNTTTFETAVDASVTKRVQGIIPESLDDKTFQFELQELDEDGKYVATLMTSSAIEANGKFEFKDEAGKSILTYDKASIGKHYYVIHELGENADGWTLADDYRFTVEVVQNADRSLTTKVNGVESNNVAATMTNKYAATGEATISVYKTVNGSSKAKENETFTFELWAADRAGDMRGDEALQTVTAKAGETVSFDAVKLTDEGPRYFVIHETMESGDGWTVADDVNVAVTATDDGSGTLKNVTVKYSNGTNAAAFDNAYTSTAKATVNVSKTVVGGTDQTADETFDFELKDSDGNVVDTVTGVRDGGTASFKALEFSTSDLAGADSKDFNYVVHEVGHNSDGWTAAADVPVTVTVTEGVDRSLSAVVSYGGSSADTAAKFENRYSTSGDASFAVYKTVNGGTEGKADEEFSFDLYEGRGTSGKKALQTVTTKAGAVKAFDDVKITAPGTYYYTIHETGHNSDGWKAASDVIAKVVATDNGKGELSCEVTYESATKDSAALFNNTYEATGSATISVNKVVNGGTEAAEGESFDFVLTDEDGIELDAVSATAGETVSFDAIEYDFEDVGKTYTYTIHETGHNEDGWFAASDVTAKVTIEDNNDGTLKATVEYSNPNAAKDAALFDNTKSAATGKIEIKKTVNGGPAQTDEHFTFELKPQDDAPAAEKTTADTFGGDTCDFGDIEFTEPGTYTYVIHETSELGDGWTNDEDVTVTVKVVRDEENKCLKVESIDYGERAYEADGVKMAHFDNKYEEAPTTPEEEQPKQEEKKENAMPDTGDHSQNAAVPAFAAAGLAFVAASMRRRRKEE